MLRMVIPNWYQITFIAHNISSYQQLLAVDMNKVTTWSSDHFSQPSFLKSNHLIKPTQGSHARKKQHKLSVCGHMWLNKQRALLRVNPHRLAVSPRFSESVLAATTHFWTSFLEVFIGRIFFTDRTAQVPLGQRVVVNDRVLTMLIVGESCNWTQFYTAPR
jgi:hypothetical protein